MLIRKSVPFYNNSYLLHDGKPIFNRNRIPQRQRDGLIKRDSSPVPQQRDGVIKRDSSPVPQQRDGVIERDSSPVRQQKKIGAKKRISIRQTIKSSPKYRSPVANRKRSSPVPREKNWDGQLMDSELNELDWLEEQW
jgi:hypothetical protein